jgi:Spy/CpxP family protein refolding chaperone
MTKEESIMKRLKLNRTAAGVACALLLATAGVYAETDGGAYGHKREGGRMEAKFKEMEKELGLSADQAKKLEEHRKAHREDGRKLMEQMKQKRMELNAELEKPSVNMDRVKVIHNELKDIQNKMADERLDGIVAVRKILTPEQFKKFHEMKKNEWGRDGKGMRGKGKRGMTDGDGDMPK